MNDVIEYLLNFCKSNDIMVCKTNELPPRASSDSSQNPKLIIYNVNYYIKNEMPFILAHEIGHVLCGDPFYLKKFSDGKFKEECIANSFAIYLLGKYCNDNDIFFDSIYNFASAFGIPKKYQYLLDKKQLKFINKLVCQ